ncbi:MAG: DUF308 domain-containing protein [Lachnospiraceae bacterium]|nr:DUF308 domain-containing protein [Lachnospiraceae bacterium]
MSKMRRVKEILVGLLMILMAIIFFVSPTTGYIAVIVVLSVIFIIIGLKKLWFFLTMASRMVGGRRVLYEGLLILDLGFFTAGINFVPTVYVMIYLGTAYVFAGAIDILNAIDAKKLESSRFKGKLIIGAINIIIGILCFVFLTKNDFLVFIICLGLIYNAIVRIANAFRKHAMVYIQ